MRNTLLSLLLFVFASTAYAGTMGSLGGSGGWTKTGTVLHPTTATDDLGDAAVPVDWSLTPAGVLSVQSITEIDSGLFAIGIAGGANFASVIGRTTVTAGSATTDGTIIIYDDATSDTVTIQALDGLAASYTLTLPPDAGGAGEVLGTNGVGVLDWQAAGGAPATADISDVAVTQTELAELETIGATVIEAADWTALAALVGVNTGDQTINTADIADVAVTQTELAELEAIGATVIDAANWTALSNLSGVNTGDGAIDTTAVDDTTWSDDANATNTWTFDVSGQDHTMIAGDGVMTFSHDVAVDADLEAASLTITPSATPTVGFDDSVADDDNLESKIVGDAIADDNGSLSLQVENNADGTYYEGVLVKSTAGVISVQLGGNGTADYINVADNGVLTGEGTATIEADALTGTIPGTVDLTAGMVDAGDYAADSIDEDDLNPIITFDDDMFVNMAAIDVSDGSEGLILPQGGEGCAGALTAGQICWDETLNDLWVGDGAGGPTQINIAGSTAWDDIGDPDGDGTVDMNEYDQDLAWDTGDVTAAAFEGLTISLKYDPSTTDSGTQSLVAIRQLDSENDAYGQPEALLLLENLDGTSNDAVLAALKVLGYGNMPTAIDISDAEIGVGINLGSNTITSTSGIELTSGATATECVMLEASGINCFDTGGCTAGEITGTYFDSNVAVFTAADGAGTWDFGLPANIVNSQSASAELFWTSNDTCDDTDDDICMTLQVGSFTESDAWTGADLAGPLVGLTDSCHTSGDLHRASFPAYTIDNEDFHDSFRGVVRVARDDEGTDAECDTGDDDFTGDVQLLAVRLCYEVHNVFSGEGT